MPSFDVVSDFDAHEAANAVDQANREVNTRFDFKGTGSKYELDQQVITLTSQSEFQLQQMMDILRQKLAKRGVDIGCLDEQAPETTGSTARQTIILLRGIDTDVARRARRSFDVCGHYARSDILSLSVDRSPQEPVRFSE